MMKLSILILFLFASILNGQTISLDCPSHHEGEIVTGLEGQWELDVERFQREYPDYEIGPIETYFTSLEFTRDLSDKALEQIEQLKTQGWCALAAYKMSLIYATSDEEKNIFTAVIVDDVGYSLYEHHENYEKVHEIMFDPNADRNKDALGMYAKGFTYWLKRVNP